MRPPDAVQVIAGSAYLLVALVVGRSVPRLLRLARRHPPTRRGAYCWAALCAVLLTAGVAYLLAAPTWLPTALCILGLAGCLVALWPLRASTVAVLRGTGPHAQAPTPPVLELPLTGAAQPAQSHPSGMGGNRVDSVETARRLYGPDLGSGSATGLSEYAERRGAGRWRNLNPGSPGERSHAGSEDA